MTSWLDISCHQAARTGCGRSRLRCGWSGVSVAFGIVSGAVSATTGLADHSLSALAVGPGVLPT